MDSVSNVFSHKVLDMEPHKREKLINAAMAEFCKGYKNASTDAIVRDAGISKGLLFHYFGSKEKLYEFVIEYSINAVKEEFFGLINFKTPDILDRIWQMMLLKMDLTYKYPALFDFLAQLYAKTIGDKTDSFVVQYRKMQESVTARLFEGIDKSCFREGLDAGKVVNIIWWTLMGYANAQTGADKSMEDYRNEYGNYLEAIKGYFEIFKKAFYK